MDKLVKKYLSTIGSLGGKKSRRKLDPTTAREMVKVRECQKAFKRFHSSCFWSYDPNYKISTNDISWVAKQLMKNGGRQAWEIGAKLCR